MPQAVDRLASERGPAAPREEGDLLPPRDVHHRLDVGGVARHDDADRLHLIDRRVGRVEEPRGGIEANVPGNDRAKVVLEVVHAGIILCVFAAALAALALGLALASPGEAAPAAPGFRVRLLDGKTTIDSRALIGRKVLVLRFQASWCRVCVKESPALARIAERYRARGVEVLAIHVQDTAADVQRFVREHRPTYKVALDPRLAIGNRFGFRGTPYTVVVDLRGEMVARIHGVSAVTRLPRILDTLVGRDRR